MDQNDTDLLMRFVLKDGGDVWGECSIDIDDKDTLAKGFTKNATYDTYTNFFEINDFDFGLSLKDEQPGGGKGGAAGGAGGGAGGGARGPIVGGYGGSVGGYRGGSTPQNQLSGGRPGGPAGVAGAAGGNSGAGRGAFASWRSATDAAAKLLKFPLEFDKFSFSKVIDAASPILFQNCVNSIPFLSATLVKRISQGGEDAKGMRPTVSYLSFEFKSVYITSINWDDGEVVKEKIQFTADYLMLRYRPQLEDGTVSTKGEQMVEWNGADGRGENIRKIS